MLAILIGLGVTFYVFTGALATFGGMFLMVDRVRHWDFRASRPQSPYTDQASAG